MLVGLVLQNKMRFLLIFIMFFVVTLNSDASYQLNVHTGEFELAPPGSQYRLNIHTGEFELGSK